MRSYYHKQLLVRLLLFFAGVFCYAARQEWLEPGNEAWQGRIFRLLLWAGVFLDILKKFFPSGRLSLGAQKLFAGRYRAADCSAQRLKDSKRRADGYALFVAAVWIGFNLIFFVLYRQGIIGVPELILLTLFYFLSDMICVLHFCPFRLMMHTRCCTTCRIFNWDSMMMCTPLLFIGGIYGWSLAAFAMAVLIHWETLYSRFPERFFECSNESLRCGNCEGNLCRGRLKRRDYCADRNS